MKDGYGLMGSNEREREVGFPQVNGMADTSPLYALLSKQFMGKDLDLNSNQKEIF